MVFSATVMPLLEGNARPLPECMILWRREDTVGIHTNFAPSAQAASTALRLMPPTELFSAIPPNTLHFPFPRCFSQISADIMVGA